ncbi:MAG: hypothetical protein ACJ8FY_01990 [Gemmataceae bacterium]
MSNNIREFHLLLWTMVLVAFFRPHSTQGTFPRVEEPSPLFTGKVIPEPPQQKAKWQPPDNELPKEFVDAATLLFDQGLADPRGCEYRVISVTTGSCWTGDGGVIHTRGWMLPTEEGAKHRFAVCWNGLVYPLVTIGDKADLHTEVKQVIDDRKKERNRRGRETDQPQSEEGWSLWHHSLGNLETALLLRLGEGALASDLWEANHQPPKGGENNLKREESDPYLGLAASWGWIQFDRALGAHMRGDDVLALSSFRRLSAFNEKVEEETKKRGIQPQKEAKHFLSFVDQLPELLADQERRAMDGGHDPVVCIGPGRLTDQTKRIAALVARLDEVNARQWGQPGGVSLSSDLIVEALIREGEPALEALLNCFAEDRRMTRSVHFWRDFSQSRTCLGVHEAAYVALSGILAQSDFEPRATGDNLTRNGDDTRKKLAELIHEHVKTAKKTPPAQRWFAILADDKANPEQWVGAAKRLMVPDDVAIPSGTMVWSGRSVRLRQSEKGGKLVAESLRKKQNPSVTELLLKRMNQTENVHISADLALTLAVWEPKASIDPLLMQMKRLREGEHWYGYTLLIDRICELGDQKGLNDYVVFINKATLKMLGDSPIDLFSPMVDHLDHPGMAQAAENLFGNEKSPWLPLMQLDPERSGVSRVPQLIPTGTTSSTPVSKGSPQRTIQQRRGRHGSRWPVWLFDNESARNLQFFRRRW